MDSRAWDIFFNVDGEALLCVDPVGPLPAGTEGRRGVVGTMGGVLAVRRPDGAVVRVPGVPADLIRRVLAAPRIVVAESTGKALVAEYEAAPRR